MKLFFTSILFIGLAISAEPFHFPEKISNCKFYKQDGRPLNYSRSLPLFLGWYTCEENFLNSLYIYPMKKGSSFKALVSKILKNSFKNKKEGRIKYISPPNFIQGLQMIEASVATKGAREEIGYQHQFYYFKVNNESYVLAHSQGEDLLNQHKKKTLLKVKEIISAIKKK